MKTMKLLIILNDITKIIDNLILGNGKNEWLKKSLKVITQ